MIDRASFSSSSAASASAAILAAAAAAKAQWRPQRLGSVTRSLHAPTCCPASRRAHNKWRRRDSSSSVPPPLAATCQLSIGDQWLPVGARQRDRRAAQLPSFRRGGQISEHRARCQRAAGSSNSGAQMKTNRVSLLRAAPRLARSSVCQLSRALEGPKHREQMFSRCAWKFSPRARAGSPLSQAITLSAA